MDDIPVDFLEESIELVLKTGAEPTLENIIKATIYLKRFYELSYTPSNKA